jgi:hypothetical protein
VTLSDTQRHSATLSDRMGHAMIAYRISLSILHALGSSLDPMRYGITDLHLSTDLSSDGIVLNDDQGEFSWFLPPVDGPPHPIVGRQAWNRKDKTQKRIVMKVDGVWQTPTKKKPINCACANANAMMVIHDNVEGWKRVCYWDGKHIYKVYQYRNTHPCNPERVV